MRNIKFLALVLCLMCFGLLHTNAQSNNKVEDKLYKVEMLEVPDIVKETLKSYSGYKISKDVSYKLKSSHSKSDKIYRFTIERKKRPYVLLVDEKGKVKGIESEEGK